MNDHCGCASYQVRGNDLWVVPGDVVESQVVRQDEEDVGLLSLLLLLLLLRADDGKRRREEQHKKGLSLNVWDCFTEVASNAMFVLENRQGTGAKTTNNVVGFQLTTT